MYIVKHSKVHLIYISFFIYILINLIENLLHYNIGINRNKNDIKLYIPVKKDWTRIIIVMIIFALLQGLLTYFFTYYI